MQEYRIKCTRWGGVCGFGQAYLKESGKEYRTTNRAAAIFKAANLSREMNHANATASFTYVVEPVKEERS